MTKNLETGQGLGGHTLDDNLFGDYLAYTPFNLFTHKKPRAPNTAEFKQELYPEQPITQDDSNPITFNMVGQIDKFCYLDSIELLGTTILERKKAEGNGWEPIVFEEDLVSVVNNHQHAMFGKIVVQLNETEIVDPSSNPYPYTSYLTTLFNTKKSYKEEQLSVTQGYYLDDPKKHNAFQNLTNPEWSECCLLTAGEIIVNKDKLKLTPAGPGYLSKHTTVTETQAFQATTTEALNLLTNVTIEDGFITVNDLVMRKPDMSKSNSGWSRRRRYYDQGKSVGEGGNNKAVASEVFFISNIQHDIATSSNVLPPNTKIRFLFTKMPDSFTILQTKGSKELDKKYRLRLVDMRLRITSVEVIDRLAAEYMRNLRRGITPKIYFTRNFIKSYTVIPAHFADFGNNNFITNNIIPDTIVIGFVKQDAYLGNSTSNPFFFEEIEFNQINLIINGFSEPKKPMKNITQEDKLLMYEDLQRTCGKNQKTSESLDLSFKQWSGGGYFFLYFDLTLAKDNRATPNPVRRGNLSIVLKTHEPEKLQNDATRGCNWSVIVFCVYSSMIEFHGDHIEVTQFT